MQERNSFLILITHKNQKTKLVKRQRNTGTLKKPKTKCLWRKKTDRDKKPHWPQNTKCLLRARVENKHQSLLSVE